MLRDKDEEITELREAVDIRDATLDRLQTSVTEAHADMEEQQQQFKLALAEQMQAMLEGNALLASERAEHESLLAVLNRMVEDYAANEAGVRYEYDQLRQDHDAFVLARDEDVAALQAELDAFQENFLETATELESLRMEHEQLQAQLERAQESTQQSFAV